MLTYDQAKKIVVERLSKVEYSIPNDSLIIIDELTIEKPYAWIFVYTSKLFYETNESEYIIAGNSPIIVDKHTGNQTTYSSAYGIDSIIDKYEEEQKLWNLILVDITSIENDKLLLLKNKMNLSYNSLFQLKTGKIICIDSGSQLRLINMQFELLKIGIETKVELSRNEI